MFGPGAAGGWRALARRPYTMPRCELAAIRGHTMFRQSSSAVNRSDIHLSDEPKSHFSYARALPAVQPLSHVALAGGLNRDLGLLLGH